MSYIRRGDVLGLWAWMEPMIAPALERNDSHTTWDLQRALLSGEMLAWVVMLDEEPVALMVTEIAAWPSKRALLVVTLAGSRMDEWVEDAEAALMRYAVEHGCTALQACVRNGLVRTLGRRGWRKVTTIIEKGIN